MRHLAVAGLVLSLCGLPGTDTQAQMTDLPQLVLESGGSVSYITSLAFSPDSRTLYVAGFDKVVRVWRRDANSARFRFDPRTSYRVPIGPGEKGAINTVALSADGRWLAAAGRGLARGEAGPQNNSRIVAAGAASPEMLSDIGLIYVFDTNTGDSRQLRGHQGEVLSLRFAPGEAPILVSAGTEMQPGQTDWTGSLRLWDVRADQPQLKQLDISSRRRPSQIGLGVKSMGPRPQDLLLAWQTGDGKSHSWRTLEAVGRSQTPNRGGNNDTLASATLASGKTIAVTGLQVRRDEGRIYWWDLDARSPTPRLTFSREVPAPPKFFSVPRSLALTTSGQDRSILVAVAALEMPRERRDGGGKCVLHLLTDKPSIDEHAKITLWPANPYRPRVSASPDGTLLAVAGSGHHDVRIYAVRDIQAGKKTYEVLQGVGVDVRKVAFAHQNDDVGLAIEFNDGEDGKPDLLFDFGQNRLHDKDLDGWSVDVPTASPWQIRTGQRSGTGAAPLVLQHPDGRRHTISPLPGQQFTAASVALCNDAHVAAIAAIGGGGTTIDLYDAERGNLVRKCTAHTMAVRALSFSRDGRFLVSAGADQLICVWSLIDLDLSKARRGVPPVVIRDEDDAVQVANLRTPDGALQPGDQLLGIVRSGRLQPLGSAADYYRVFWEAEPGSRQTLRRVRDGVTADATVTGIALVDERNPLFSFFAIRDAGQPVPWQWVGWNPLGPYDASSDQAEQFIGWHFNTGRADSPTLFSSADEYREQFHRKGLLGQLVTNGKLTATPPPPPPKRPDMRLEIDGLPARDGLVQTDVLPKQAQLLLLDPNTPGLTSVRLLIDGEPAGDFDLEAPGRWTASLAETRWRHGDARQVQAELIFASEHRFQSAVQAEYRYPSPRVTLRSDAEHTTMQSAYQLQMSLEPAVEDAPLRYLISRETDGKRTSISNEVIRREQDIDLELPLAVGTHRIRVEAFYEGVEPVQRVVRHVRVTRLEEEKPKIDILPKGIRFSAALSFSEESELPIVPGKEVIINSRELAVFGSIDSSKEITDAFWRLGATTGKLRLDAGTPRSFTSVGDLPFKPGAQSLVLVAKVDGHQASTELQVQFRPPLPNVTIISPQNSADFLQDEVDVLIKLDREASSLVEESVLLVNGRALQHRREGSFIRSTVRLIDGENTIQISLSNRFQETPKRHAVVVRRLRPPVLKSIKMSEVGRKPLVDIEATVESSLPLVRANINGERVVDSQIEPAGERLWKVIMRGQPLSPGNNRFLISCHNRDGRSNVLEQAMMYEEIPPPPPVVLFRSPRADTTTAEIHQTIDYLVESESPLERVELIQNASIVYQSAQLPRLRPTADGRMTLDESVEVTLDSGSNQLQLIAVNAGGRTSAEINLSVPRVPARVIVDRVTAGARPLPRPKSENGITLYPATNSSTIVVSGRIRLNNQPDQRPVLHTWVNGFQQKPLTLSWRPGQKEIEFDQEVMLNRRSNQVELRVPQLTIDSNSDVQFRIDCVNPDESFGIHLLIVGVGVKDADRDKLQAGALQALRAEPIGQSRTTFSTSAFQAGKIYGPITGDPIQREQVMEQLFQIKKTIQAGTVSNNVVMIYYQGGEIIYDANRFFLTTSTEALRRQWSESDLQREAIDSEDLELFINAAHGAHVLFLDVARGPKDLVSTLEGNSQAGLIRYAWVKDNPATGSARLLLALKDALKPPKNLGDVADLLSRKFELKENRLVSKDFEDSLMYEGHIPVALRPLQITGGEE